MKKNLIKLEELIKFLPYDLKWAWRHMNEFGSIEEETVLMNTITKTAEGFSMGYKTTEFKPINFNNLNEREQLYSDDRYINDISNPNEILIPLVYPLSDLVNNAETKYLHIRDEFSDYHWNLFIDSFFLLGGGDNRFDFISTEKVDMIIKEHLDIFGWLNHGLAFNLNKIK